MNNASYKAVPATAIAALVSLTAQVAAEHPQPNQMATVQELAHEAADAARHVHRDAERNRHHYGHREERALVALHDFETQARHFHRQVERYAQNPYHTEDDFDALWRSFRTAEHSMRGLHAFDHVERDFARASWQMNELADYYLPATNPGHYGRGHYEDRDYRHGRGQARERYRHRRDRYSPGLHIEWRP